MPSGTTLIALSTGNTRTRIGRFDRGRLEASAVHGNDELAALVGDAAAWWQDSGEATLVQASVDGPAALRVRSAIEDQLGVEVYRVGADLPVPIATQLDPETITGADRLLNALAAWTTVQQACVVVDAGTAVTVDFVDGTGVFQGGAIAPGARMQLRALHEHTDALPDLTYAVPDDDAFGRSTAQAMLRGVHFGIRGMMHALVERYAEAYEAYPMVIATGGDAAVLFGDDELVDRIVPDLTLMGIAVAARMALGADPAS